MLTVCCENDDTCAWKRDRVVLLCLDTAHPGHARTHAHAAGA